MQKYRRILALGAHTDDIELGCGGLLNRFVKGGAEIRTLVFSDSRQSLPSHMPENTLLLEYKRSMEVIGITDNAEYKLYPVRNFFNYRQDILEDLVNMNRDFAPDLVITMNSSDIHQDHKVVFEESRRAFKRTNVIAYELPWNQFTSDTELLVEIDADDLNIKKKMVRCYESQIHLGRSYINDDYIETAARFRGFQGRLALAEAYEVIGLFWRVE